MIRNDPFMTARVNTLVGPKPEEYRCVPTLSSIGEEAVHLEIFRYGPNDTFSIDIPADIAGHLSNSILSDKISAVAHKHEQEGGKLTYDNGCCYYCSWPTENGLQAVAYGLNEDLRIALMISSVETQTGISFKQKASHLVVYCPLEDFYNLGRNLRFSADGLEMTKERRLLGL